jgi:thymidine phosphorylase
VRHDRGSSHNGAPRPARQPGGSSYLPQELIRAKRDGRGLDADELRFIAGGIADGTLSDAQVAAFAMAVFFRGLDGDERATFTAAMRDSGTVLDWSGQDLPGPVLDKHSTGGVGDKVSLILAPVVAACGGAVPMISGRGLGHTGGTLDKLDAIPGYDSTPGLTRFRAAVREAGCAIVGQTADLAPADRRLYAIRDASGSVESLPLIVSSILSKKLAAGLDALVLDVKWGSGAFSPTLAIARELAYALVEVADANGLAASALLTDMNQCLGSTAGNALEVREAIDMLAGRPTDPRLGEVTRALSARLLVLGGVIDDRAAAEQAVDRALAGGEAAERFARMVVALGGPPDLVERPQAHLEDAPVVTPVVADRDGFVGAIDARALGLVVVALGGGRRRESDPVDPAVGLSDVVPLGTEVGPGGRPIAVVHARDKQAAAEAAAAVRRAVAVADAPPEPAPPITEELTLP